MHGERRARLQLFAYALTVVGASWLSAPLPLLLGIVVALLLAGRQAYAILRRALLATLMFTATVSATYAGYVWWHEATLPWQWLLTINLRVLLMALLTFLFIARVNLFLALGFSRRLSFLLVLAVSQSLGLRRTLADFRLALQSRGIRPTGLRDRYRAAAHAAAWLLDRALANAHESAQALQSRGLFK